MRPALEFVRSEVRRSDKAYRSLYEIAKDWDEEGHTTLDEFLDAVECELFGTPRQAVVLETMTEIGTMAAHQKRALGL